MKKNILIEGMNCGHCTSSVEKALRAVPGVTDVCVDLGTKTASVDASDDVPVEALTSAVTDTGFAVSAIR